MNIPNGFSIGKNKQGLPTLKINFPEFVAKLGGRKWLVDRALHMPQAVVDGLDPVIEERAQGHLAMGLKPSAAYLRAYESVLSDMVYDGVVGVKL